VTLVGGTPRRAERLAEQATNGSRRLAAGTLTEREALVGATTRVVRKTWQQEPEDQQKHANPHYGCNQHNALLLIGVFEISALAAAFAVESSPADAEVEVAAPAKPIRSRVAGKNVGTRAAGE
jgi:hypothetical protein